MGKAIYQPKGKAKEYGEWAVNFYNGCTANCEYCYCKKGFMKSNWSNEPTLKKSLINEQNALKIFYKEAESNQTELKKHGLFFNFTSDPLLLETAILNLNAMVNSTYLQIPVICLTKQVWFIASSHTMTLLHQAKPAIGFTLTGRDELELGAAPNYLRIDAMEFLHGQNFNTWASIEPIIDFRSSLEMIKKSLPYCSHYKIGLLSGKEFDQEELNQFIADVNLLVLEKNKMHGTNTTIYYKESIMCKASIVRENLPKCCVEANYKFWIR